MEGIAVRRWVLWGIPVIFLVGTLLHFAYEWTGEFWLVGIFAPVNESVWEHLKMAFWPILGWWGLGSLLFKDLDSMERKSWMIACSSSAVTAPMVIVAFFYSYTGALGIESIVLDIFSLFLGIKLGQLLGLHLYNYLKARNIFSVIAVTIILVMILAFIVFTFYPPDLPIFIEASS